MADPDGADSAGDAGFDVVLTVADHPRRVPRDAQPLARQSERLRVGLRTGVFPRDQYVDLRGKVQVCGDSACQPIPVPLRVPTDFLWQRNPFQLTGGGSGVIESAGVDYILPYWMGRVYGLDGAGISIHSAAAPSAGHGVRARGGGEVEARLP